MPNADKIEIADEMLDAAICLFLDKQQFFASLNLAGVAEELYGKFIRLSGGRDIQQELVEAAGKIGPSRGSPELSPKEWKKIAVHFKNAIKHFDSENDLAIYNNLSGNISSSLSKKLIISTFFIKEAAIFLFVAAFCFSIVVTI